MTLQKLLVFVTLLIEVLGISIIIPAFPELKIYYGIGDFEVTVALAIYSLFAFISAPLLGQLSDKIGRKISLSWCIAGTALSYFLLLIQPWYWIFILSRIINGITGGNISIIYAILTDLSPDKESKNKNFGLLGAFFGLGFIVGPFLGSVLLGRGGVEAIFRFGGVLALLQFILLVFRFVNTNILIHNKQFQYNPLHTIKKYIGRPQLKPWLYSLVMLGIGGFIINAGQSLYMHTIFGTSGITYGYYLSGLGVLIAINMGVLIPAFRTKKFTTKQLLFISYSMVLIGHFSMALLLREIPYVVILYITGMIGGIYGVIYNVQIMSYAQEGEIGELSGMVGSLQNLTMVIAPVLSGILLELSFNIHRGAVVFFITGILVMMPYITAENTDLD